jgi:hypothetical protein
MFLSYHLLYRIAIALLIAALVIQHGVEANSVQTPLLMGGGNADMSIWGVDAASGEDDEVGDASGDDFHDKLHDHFDGFDDEKIDTLGDEDLADIQTDNSILNIGRCKRRVNFFQERIHWERHVREIQETDIQASGNTGFDKCSHMRPINLITYMMPSRNISPLISKDLWHLLREMITFLSTPSTKNSRASSTQSNLVALPRASPALAKFGHASVFSQT